MITKTLLACAAALALCSTQANAITFTTTQFEVNAVATTDGPASVETASGAGSATPLTASAFSLGAADIATAGAIGALGLLSTSADVSGGASIPNAVATSRFTGSFVSDTPETWLNIDFLSSSFSTGTTTASTSVFMTLIGGGVTLFQGFVDSSSSFSNYFAPGTTGSLDLLLTSEALGGFPASGFGNASSFGQIAITSAVPLPGPWLLLLAGIGPVLRARKRKQAEAALA